MEPTFAWFLTIAFAVALGISLNKVIIFLADLLEILFGYVSEEIRDALWERRIKKNRNLP